MDEDIIEIDQLGQGHVVLVIATAPPHRHRSHPR